jgi:hypothetical protein
VSSHQNFIVRDAAGASYSRRAHENEQQQQQQQQQQQLEIHARKSLSLSLSFVLQNDTGINDRRR